ncbi:MAG: nucleotidyltransferase [Gammaproteobacteria bacterium]|nr:nucleotidyltransferase [Gammaproteobacteria bacterium]
MVASYVDVLLALWSRQGDDAASARTYQSIKAAIESDAALRIRSVEVYLQGSYANATNISGDSDVDIVVQSGTTFRPEYREQVLPYERVLLENSFGPAQYNYAAFRGDVARALRRAFPARTQEGNKALKVAATHGQVNADVVPAFDYRLYYRRDWFETGMVFWARDGEMFVNFPKQHRANGEAKNGRCNGNFKPTVRILKNLRNALYESGALPEDSVPSYYLECLVSNAADVKFHPNNLRQRVDDVLADLASALIAREHGWGNEIMSLNGIIPLFGDGNTQWNTTDARAFVGAARAWLA